MQNCLSIQARLKIIKITPDIKVCIMLSAIARNFASKVNIKHKGITRYHAKFGVVCHHLMKFGLESYIYIYKQPKRLS